MTLLSLRMKIVFIITMLAFIAGGAWIYKAQEHQYMIEAQERLMSIAKLKADQIAAWRGKQIAQVLMLQDSPFFMSAARRFTVSQDPQDKKTILDRFANLKKHYDYEDIIFLASDKSHLISLGKQRVLHEGYIESLDKAVKLRKPLLTDLHTEKEHPEPHIAVVMPIFASVQDNSAHKGTIIFVQNASTYLYPLIKSWPLDEKTPETLIVRREGESVLFLNDLRYAPDAAMKLRLPISRTDMIAVKGVLGAHGIIEGKDYRGVEVVGSVMPIPDTTWLMISKQDSSEVFADLRVRSLLILALVVSMLGMLVGIGLFIFKREEKNHYRDRYEYEAALRHSLERQSITLRSIGDAVISADAKGRVELLNPVAEMLTGWSNEDAKGRPVEEVFNIVNENTRSRVESPVERVLREGVVVGLANHTILISKDGKELPIADSGAPIIDESGEVTGVVLVFRDQTPERQAQKKIMESEERFRDMIVGAPDAIYIQTNRKFAYVNEEALKLFGADNPSKILGTPVFDRFHPDFHELVKERIRILQEDRKPVKKSVEQIYLRLDGSEVWVETSAHPIIYEGKKGALVFVRDISDRKALENQLMQAQKMESVGRLAGGVAHDFNNMLGVIIGYSELALAKIDSADPLKNNFEEILKTAKRSADLTSQLLAFARKQTISPRILDLNRTVDGMLTMLRRLIGEDIDLMWVPGADLWKVKMDPAQIEQVLANLCVNSRDAICGTGKVTIETRNVVFSKDYCAANAGFEPGEYVQLSVSDNGCGMDKDTINKVFEPFFTTKEVGKGTGLGLATVYGIIQQNKGFIKIYSEPGVGTTLKIFFTRQHEDASVSVPELHIEPVHGRGETVLMVEDEPAILAMGKIMLDTLGYRVLSAARPKDALNIAKEHAGRIDLVITDVIMPEMNGKELAAELKVISPGLKRLFMSGYTADVIAHHGMLDEGVNFIQKPFSVKDLAAKVREVLDKKISG